MIALLWFAILASPFKSKSRLEAENATLIGQRCAGLSSHSTDWEHHVTSDPRWASSLLRSGLGFRYRHRPKDCSASFSDPMMERPWCRFRREARARERHQHSIGGSSESGFAAVGPSGHTISPHPSSREGHHDSQEQKLRGPRCAAASIRSRHKAGRPCCCIWRTPSSRSSSIVRELLQSSSNALIAEQGCAGNPFHRNRWPHSGRANPGRIAP